MKLSKLTYISVAILTFASCTKTEFDPYEAPDSGSADFSNYISIGSSFTQGFQDGGLHNEFQQQENSYPAIISAQMGVSFKQPLVTGAGSGYMHLAFLNEKIEVIKAYDCKKNDNHQLAISYDPSFLTWTNQTTTYNNLAIGGLNVRNVISFNSTDAITNYILFGGGTPSGQLAWNCVAGEPISPYGRFLNFGSISNPVDYIEHVKNSKATFFTCWLGVHDVMGWANAGGDDVSGSSILTPVASFRTKYDALLDTLKLTASGGVCATVHDITEAPFFNTVTLEVLGKDIWIKEGADTNIIRKAVKEDLLLLSSSSLIKEGKGLTMQDPLPHQQVLDKDEVIIVKNYINAINAEIRASAQARAYAVLDMYQFMKTLNSGNEFNFDGINFTTEFIKGGFYSVDGVHPNSRGYAMIANEYIEVINASYGANLKTVAVSDYRGLTFP
ncbi:MAG: SGNH/GDSL hydrolase family protein [Vicingaceae bacterium]|nr:SGNH/GDSL hydrolase family protein [Vicingaceae bacterium]